MEKGIEIVARYHCPKEYFVEVTTEKSVLAGRDYWLCKKKQSTKSIYVQRKIQKWRSGSTSDYRSAEKQCKEIRTTVITGSCIFGGKFVGTPAVS